MLLFIRILLTRLLRDIFDLFILSGKDICNLVLSSNFVEHIVVHRLHLILLLHLLLLLLLLVLRDTTVLCGHRLSIQVIFLIIITLFLLKFYLFRHLIFIQIN